MSVLAEQSTVQAEDPAGWEEPLARVQRWLMEGETGAAVALARKLAVEWPDVPEVQRYGRILGPPVVRVVPGRRLRPLDADYAWLREHAKEYPGCWIVTHGDRLIAADPDVKEVLAIARQEPNPEELLLHHQPAAPSCL